MFPPTTTTPVGQASAGAHRPPGLQRLRSGGAGREPAGRRHLPHLHGHPLPAGRRGVCPHQKGEDNSYASSALLNQLDWKRTAACPGLVEYYRGLIGLRNAFPRLSAPDPDTPRAVRFLPVEAPLVAGCCPPGRSRPHRGPGQRLYRHTLATQTEADVVIDDFAPITDLNALLL